MDRTYYVYVLASRSRSVYTDVTNNLERRMREHREGRVSGFAWRYSAFRLVHFEEFVDIRDAIAREKAIKGWNRERKVELIDGDNPGWEDLAEGIFGKLARAKKKAGGTG